MRRFPHRSGRVSYSIDEVVNYINDNGDVALRSGAAMAPIKNVAQRRAPGNDRNASSHKIGNSQSRVLIAGAKARLLSGAIGKALSEDHAAHLSNQVVMHPSFTVAFALVLGIRSGKRTLRAVPTEESPLLCRHCVPFQLHGYIM